MTVPNTGAHPQATRSDAHLATWQFAIGLLFSLTWVVFAIWARFPVPYRDDWDWLRSLLTTPLTLRTLFEPHNEHLIPLPRLMFALQYRLEGTGGLTLFAVAVATFAVMGLVFWQQIRTRWPGDPLMRRFAFGVAAPCLFFTYQLQSVVFVAAILFPLVQMFAVVACAAAATATSERDRAVSDRQAWVLAVAAMVGAALTTTNGLIVPLLLALLALVSPRRSRAWAAFMVVQALWIVGYLALVAARSNQQSPVSADRWSLDALSSMLAFFLSFFGSGVVYSSSAVGVVVGGLFFAAGVYALWTVVRDGGHAPQIERFAAGLLIFTWATAAMAAVGRAEFGVVQAAQSRYATFTFVYWAALIVWAVSRLDGSAFSRRGWKVIMTTAVVCTGAGLLVQVFLGVVWIAKADNLSFASLTLATGVDDDEWVETLHPEMHHVYEVRQLLVAEDRWDLADRRIGTAFTSAGPPCEGEMRSMPVRPGPGLRLEGALNTNNNVAVVTDGGSHIVGLAQALPIIEMANPMQMDVVAAVWRWFRSGEPDIPRWSGFIRDGEGLPYTVHVQDADGRVVCRALVSPAD